MGSSESDLKPRRLPKQLRSQQTVDAIFEAAIQVLEREERADPSVQRIADRAGVSVGSLYQYFPTKQALVSALIRFHLEQRMDELEKAFESAHGMTGEQAAAHLVENLVGGKSLRLRIEQAMIRYFCRVGDLLALTELDGRMNAIVERFLVALGDQVRPLDTALAAFLISNALRSAVLLTIVQKPERLDDPSFKVELTRMIVGYLRPG